MKNKIILLSSYSFIILICFIIGYFASKNNKFEYGLFGIFIGIILCLILWITIVEKIYKKELEKKYKFKQLFTV